MRESIVFGDERDAVDIETSRVTLVFNQTLQESHYPSRVMITPGMALTHYGSLDEIDKFTAALFKVAAFDFPDPVTKSVLDNSQTGLRRLAGLCDMSIRLFLDNKPFGWKYPETELHPRHQTGLADIAIILSDGNAFKKFALPLLG